MKKLNIKKKPSPPVVWYLHHYAGSPSMGMSFRPYYLCREFNKNNYRAYIISASFHHLQQTPIQQNQAINHQIVDDQPYVFLKTPPYKGNGYKRFLNMFTYAWKIWRYRNHLIKITGVPSTIIVSSAHPFHYLSARHIAKKHNAKLIFEVRDLWPLSLIELANVPRYHSVIIFIKWIEKSFYKNANYVVSLLPYALPYMVKNGLSPERFFHIPNGVSKSTLDDKIDLPETYERMIAQKRKQGFFLFGYTGAHGEPNALEDLINALIILKNENYCQIHFFLVGSGNEKEKLNILTKTHELLSITFLDALSKNQILPFLEQMDACYLGWKNRPIYKYGVSPNKIFDYMLAGKPILHASVGLNDIVLETQSGCVVTAGNPAHIANGIKEMAYLSKEELKSMGARGREAVLSNFSYADLARRYMTLF